MTHRDILEDRLLTGLMGHRRRRRRKGGGGGEEEERKQKLLCLHFFLLFFCVWQATFMFSTLQQRHIKRLRLG